MEPTIDRTKLWRDLAKAAQLRSVASMLSLISAFIVFASIAGALTGRTSEKTDLRVIPWGDGSAVPASGNDLITIGIDSSDTLHMRYFDANGKLAEDTDEWKLFGKYTN